MPNFVLIVDTVSSPVFTPEVLDRTPDCTSVTYFLFVLSAMSAVVASAPAVTKPFVS